MFPRVLRVAGIIIMVFALLAAIQLFAGLGVGYFFRFHPVSGVADSPLRHWHHTDTLGILLALLTPGLIFAVGFYLRRAGSPPATLTARLGGRINARS